MICRSVAVMRRRADAYLNATQILKVAGFDKPQRTRVLEREVQKGEHEKVQGGYGKYQGELAVSLSLFLGPDIAGIENGILAEVVGTWIPIERGLALAKQYGVEDLLRPIIDYVPTSVSPPPAPKHAVAPPTKTKKDKEGKKESLVTPLKTGPTSAAALQAQAHLSGQRSTKKRIDSTPDNSTDPPSGDESLAIPQPDDDESSSETPSPVGSPVATSEMDHSGLIDGMGMGIGGSSHSRKRAAAMMEEDVDVYTHLQRARGHSAVHTPRSSPGPIMGMAEETLSPAQYTDIILNYFISETTQIPSILVSPPSNYDPNSQIDEDGHTALHWACAMGRVRVVKLLLTAGASIFSPNESEQTPLMRSVMFSNNYDVRKFPELYELLHRSTLNIDKHNRTVFHHIANLALTKGKTHAARYYMETILSRLSDYPQELAEVINFQDEDGETALTLAARARSRRLVKALLDHGADPKIKNRDFKSAEDYILEDERFRSSPIKGESNGNGSGVGGGPGLARLGADKALFAPQLYNSEAARLAGGQCLSDMTAHMQSLARSFDAELSGKERDILQAKALLTSIHTEITETSRTIQSLSDSSASLVDKKSELESIQSQLGSKLRESLRMGYETWRAGEEGREARWRAGEDAAMNGEDYSDLEGVIAPVQEGEEERLRWEIEEGRRRRGEMVAKLVSAQTEVSETVLHGRFSGVVRSQAQ